MLLWLPPVLALAELDGRLAEALPVRLLTPAVGLLLALGLLMVGLLVPVRPELLPPTRAELLPAVVGRLDMLPPTLAPWRPLCGAKWLIEPPVLLWRTLAT